MQKTMFLLAAMLLAASSAMAERIDRSEALKTASEFFGGAAGRKMAPAKGDATLRPAGEGRAYYAFNRGEGGGYVIVAADDRADRSVLGYADSGSFSAELMPPAMRWWLDEYARQIDHAATQPAGGRAIPAAPARKDIAPLLTTKWDQTSPYNALCPEYGGGRCLTGCVATAMAQIMRYHKWPERGTGSHSYDWQVDGTTVETLSADFSRSTYNWDAMTDTYGAESTGEQKDAVARLMYDAGVAVNMEYSPVVSNALDIYCASAFVDYFGYDKNLRLLHRSYYTTAEWEEIVYGALSDGRPVWYAGTTAAGGGHAFVCDGYRDGYYHINWGWSGMCDGYFLLQALDPAVQGSGGSSGAYSYMQRAMPGIRPDAGTPVEPLFYATGTFDITPRQATRSDSVTVSGGFFSRTASAVDVAVGLKIVGDDGATHYLACPDSDTCTINYGWDWVEVPLKDFPREEGEYTVFPALHDNATGRWYDIRTPINSQQRYMKAAVSASGDIAFSAPEPVKYNYVATNLRLLSAPYAGNKFKVAVTVTNAGPEYYDNVAVALIPKGTSLMAALSDWTYLFMTEGDSIGLEFAVSAPAEPGEYELAVVASDLTPISAQLPVTVAAAPAGELRLSLTAAPVIVGDGPLAADNISIRAQVECVSGYYGGRIMAGVFPYVEHGTASTVAVFADELYISAGDTATLTFSGSIPNAEVGGDYMAAILYEENGEIVRIPSDNNKVRFTIDALTPVGGVESGGRLSDIEIYSPAGVLMLRQRAAAADLSPLRPGFYIVREDGRTRKVVKR